MSKQLIVVVQCYKETPSTRLYSLDLPDGRELNIEYAKTNARLKSGYAAGRYYGRILDEDGTVYETSGKKLSAGWRVFKHDSTDVTEVVRTLLSRYLEAQISILTDVTTVCHEYLQHDVVLGPVPTAAKPFRL